MRSRGADRPDDDSEQRGEQTGRSRRLFGRAKQEPAAQEQVPGEEIGWLDDLRTAKEQRAAIGPGTPEGEAKTSKSGRTAPGPRDDDGDDEPPPRAGRDVAGPDSAGTVTGRRAARSPQADHPGADAPRRSDREPAAPPPGRSTPTASPVRHEQPAADTAPAAARAAVPPAAARAAVPPAAARAAVPPAAATPPAGRAVPPPGRGGSAAVPGGQTPVANPAPPPGVPVRPVSPSAGPGGVPVAGRPRSWHEDAPGQGAGGWMTPEAPSRHGAAAVPPPEPVTGRHISPPDGSRRAAAPPAGHEPGQTRGSIDRSAVAGTPSVAPRSAPPVRPTSGSGQHGPAASAPGRHGAPAPIVPLSGNAPEPPPPGSSARPTSPATAPPGRAAVLPPGPGTHEPHPPPPRSTPQARPTAPPVPPSFGPGSPSFGPGSRAPGRASVPPGGAPDRPVPPSTDSAEPPLRSRNATVSGRARPGAPVSGAPADARGRAVGPDDMPHNDG